MQKDIFEHRRNSYMAIGNIYFWTATINKSQRLLQDDSHKEIIIYSLRHLSLKGKIDVFAFAIMPNHIHLIWRLNALNGKESPQGSFLKYTAHEFKKKLMIAQGHKALSPYIAKAKNKQYEFWQKDPLAIPLFTKEVAFQKLDYIHYNPLAVHWQLVDDPKNYKYSTALFYEGGINNFPFIKDLREEF